MSPSDLFKLLGSQMAEVLVNSRGPEQQGLRVSKLAMEAGFEVNPTLDNVSLDDLPKFLDGKNSIPKFQIKVTAY